MDPITLTADFSTNDREQGILFVANQFNLTPTEFLNQVLNVALDRYAADWRRAEAEVLAAAHEKATPQERDAAKLALGVEGVDVGVKIL